MGGEDDPNWKSTLSDRKDGLFESIEPTDLQKSAARSLYGLDNNHSLDSEAISNKLADDFENLKQSNWEARPHIELEIDANDFNSALDRALDGESTRFKVKKNGNVEFDPRLDYGFVDLIIEIPSIEGALDIYEREESRVENLSGEELEIIEEHYASNSIHIQQELPKTLTRFFSSRGYVTLLRDMSKDCRRVVDIMYDIVDEYEELYWEEPRLYDGGGSNLFSSRLQYRGE